MLVVVVVVFSVTIQSLVFTKLKNHIYNINVILTKFHGYKLELSVNIVPELIVSMALDV
jgi:hypothetical protein